MKRKTAFALIALGFGISMELVLALHLLTRPGNSSPSSAQSANGTLVSTIAIDYDRNLTSEQDLGEGMTAPGEELLIQDPSMEEGMEQAPEGQNPSDQDLASPSDGYPVDDYPPQDLDIPPGSEPDDSAGDAGTVDDDYGNYGGHGGYPPPESPIPDPSTTPLPTNTTASPTATSQNTPVTTSAAPTATGTAATATALVTETATATPILTPSMPPTSTVVAPTDANVLLSVQASALPKIDGMSDDPAWSNAPALLVDTGGGANQSATRVSIRSVYDGENIYLLLTWADPTQSYLLNPWERQQDGSWKKLASADNQGGDENQYYMDKLALLWPIANSVPDFLNAGCAVACHSGEEPQNKPAGLMYTGGAGQTADLWHWKSVINIAQADDYLLNDTRYSKDTPRAGLNNDPGDGGYSPNQTKQRDAPAFMLPSGGEKTGAPGFILDSEKTDLDPGIFQPGDRVPSWLVAAFDGDRGNIGARWSYANGAWTLELRRKLVTGSAYDVQFDDLNKLYPFALATFDNSQLRHAVQNGAAILKFNK